MSIRVHLLLGFIAGSLIVSSSAATAQQPPKLTPRQEQLLKSIKWQEGPAEAKLGTVATIKIPAGYRFTDAAGVRAYHELNKDPHDPTVLGMIEPIDEAEEWGIFFNYENIGYVKDDEKDSLNDEVAETILKSIKEGTEEANKFRRKNGGSTLTVVGWEQKPKYDTQTNRLVWAIIANSEHGEIVNYNSRILGRGGVMSANLVVGRQELGSKVPYYNKLIEGFKYNPGENHSEWKAGDKVATYGLAALITGGGLAVAAKTGVLGKLIKPLLIGGAMLIAGLVKFWHWLTGRKKEEQSAA